MGDDEVDGCGHSRVWMLPRGHEFEAACLFHDALYDRRVTPELRVPRSVADRLFYEEMLKAAGDSVRLRCQARLFYSIVRVWGIFRY